jgi:vancomycin resistance protein VanJ
VPSSDVEERLDRRVFPGVRRRGPCGGRWRCLFAVVLQWAVWLYFGAVVATWFLLRIGGDRWWFATVMLFGPRWIYALPMAVLVPAAIPTRRGLLRPLAAAAIVLIWPIMGLCLPWGRLASGSGPAVRVLSCNIDVSAVDRRKLAALIDDAQPDLVALQECATDVDSDWPAGWHVRRAGQLLVGSRYPIRDVQSALCRHPASPWPPVHALCCLVETEAGPVRFCCIHLQSPHEGLSEVLDRHRLVNPERKTQLAADIENRRRASEDLVEWLGRFHEPLILAGDFNMPDDSSIYRRSWGQYTSAFAVSGLGFGYTKWTPVRTWRYGLRIDHILAGNDWCVTRCWVGPDVQSDHLPLLADLRLARSARHR